MCMEILFSPCYAFPIHKGEYRITMKKILFMLPFVLTLLTSCGNTSNTSSLSSTSDSTSESTTASTSTEPETVVETLDEMCSYLEEKGVVHGERITKNASMMGAIDGTGYKENHAEIYLYEDEAPKTFTVLGIEGEYNATNGKFALIFSLGYEVDNTIIECFKAVKTK